MEHYVTYLDHRFLPQGLALYQSMLRHCQPFHLWVIALDPLAMSTLQQLNLPQLTPLDLGPLETPQLLKIKPERSPVEYAWTLTPFTVGWVLQAAPQASRVTYLDADLFFLASPQPVFAELEASSRSALITAHHFHPAHDHTRLGGKYCVQFVTFERGPGEIVRQWWQDRCLEWCFDRHEPGRYGDQKYLEQFEQLFPLHTQIYSQAGVFQGPWNMRRFPPSEARVFHFSGLRIQRGGQIHFGSTTIPEVTFNEIYLPYLKVLGEQYRQLSIPIHQPVVRPSLGQHLRRAWHTLKWEVRRLWGGNPRWRL